MTPVKNILLETNENECLGQTKNWVENDTIEPYNKENKTI